MYSGSSIRDVYDQVDMCLPHLLHWLFCTLKGSNCEISSLCGPVLKLQNQGAGWAEAGRPPSFVFWCPLLWGEKEAWKSIQIMSPDWAVLGLMCSWSDTVKWTAPCLWTTCQILVLQFLYWKALHYHIPFYRSFKDAN